MHDYRGEGALIVLVVVFFVILAVFRKKITYPFCTLEKYTGKVDRGKRHYCLLIHLFVSFGMGLVSYSFLYKANIIATLQENTSIRQSTVFLLWAIWVFVIGWLIEWYLQATDKEYSDWKTAYLGK